MEQFFAAYRKISADRLDLLSTIYTKDIHFVDPAHEIRGLDRLTDYFAGLYAHITTIHFDFGHHLRLGREGYVQWEMHFAHPRLRGGDRVTVAGVSFLCFNDGGKVYYHRDYFDLGAMLYEHVPLLGRVVTGLKRRLAQ